MRSGNTLSDAAQGDYRDQRQMRGSHPVLGPRCTLLKLPLLSHRTPFHSP